MRIVNRLAGASELEVWRTVGNVNKLRAYVDSVRGKGFVEFDEIRQSVPGFESLEDGYIHQICIDAGLEVEIDD